VRRDLLELVWTRANACCEYCLIPQALDFHPFEIDHIIAERHGGPTSADNLALACLLCNSYKGPNLAGIDWDKRQIALLFDPRRQRWRRHFRYDGPILLGRTAAGRATVATLRINLPHRISQREILLNEGAVRLS
jgi:hypothetical protein